MSCPHLNNSVCDIATGIVGENVETTEKACNACREQIAPQNLNFVTSCIALNHVQQSGDMERWKRLKQYLASYLVLTPEKTKEAKLLKRIDDKAIPCEQNVGGICVVASHLAEHPIPTGGNCSRCKDLADWKMPNKVTAEMAIEHDSTKAEAYECYTESNGGVGTHLKPILYGAGVRGLRRCELEIVERMNRIGIEKCREQLDRLSALLVKEATTSQFSWIFERLPATRLILMAIARAEDGTAR